MTGDHSERPKEHRTYRSNGRQRGARDGAASCQHSLQKTPPANAKPKTDNSHTGRCVTATSKRKNAPTLHVKLRLLKKKKHDACRTHGRKVPRLCLPSPPPPSPLLPTLPHVSPRFRYDKRCLPYTSTLRILYIPFNRNPLASAPPPPPLNEHCRLPSPSPPHPPLQLQSRFALVV